jgi:hypothetical protein
MAKISFILSTASVRKKLRVVSIHQCFEGQATVLLDTHVPLTSSEALELLTRLSEFQEWNDHFSGLLVKVSQFMPLL